MTEHKNVHEAILAVMREVDYVQMKGKMDSYNAKYAYAKAEDVLSGLRKPMIEHGLTLLPIKTEPFIEEHYQTSKGGNMNRVAVRRTYRVTHAPTETFIDIEVLGEGADSGDKACNKSMTGAGKYARRETFQIEFGEDDPDRESSAEQERKSATSAAHKIPEPPAKTKFDEAFEAIGENRNDFPKLLKYFKTVENCVSKKVFSLEQAGNLACYLVPTALEACKSVSDGYEVMTALETLQQTKTVDEKTVSKLSKACAERLEKLGV